MAFAPIQDSTVILHMVQANPVLPFFRSVRHVSSRRAGLSRCLAQQRRSHSQVITDGRPFRMAVVGSGPAGFYAAYRVISKIHDAKVDMYESLPVPFGLVRFGVAPDHPEVKVGFKSSH